MTQREKSDNQIADELLMSLHRDGRHGFVELDRGIYIVAQSRHLHGVYDSMWKDVPSEVYIYFEGYVPIVGQSLGSDTVVPTRKEFRRALPQLLKEYRAWRQRRLLEAIKR